MKTLIAIPAFNEEESISAVLEDLARHHPLDHVIVIDDGSRDSTSQIARNAGVRVIRHPINLGVGAAMGTAFIFAAKHGYEALVQLDADGQHRPEFLSVLLEQVGVADVIVGSRFAGGGKFKTTFARRGAQRAISWVVSSYARTHLTDVTSGFRVAGPRAIELFSRHYPVEWLGDTVESIILASRQGLTVREVSVTMNERAGGLPSQSILKAAMYTGRIFLILVLAAFRSAPPSVINRKKVVKSK
ncbi:MAG TPA: glycosyltransferase family 2 protein [Terrimesophilobacter sp.]|nr:glycosyltransferase family 2 protein [Terrimesophilobacter sp.]